MSCLICKTHQQDLIDIFSNRGLVLQVAEIISKHFCFELVCKKKDKICQICWHKIDDFHQLYCCVQERLKGDENETTASLPNSPKTESLLVEAEVEAAPENITVKEEIQDVEVKNEHDSNDDTSRQHEYVEEVTVELPKAARKAKKVTKGQKSFQHQRLLSNNERLHLVAEYFKMQCDKCSFGFDGWNDVGPHFERVHSIPGYLICSVCERKVTKRYFAMDHIEYHMNPDAFKCEICQNRFERRKALNLHIKSHRNVGKEFQCHYCSKMFASKSVLEHHLLGTHASDAEKKYPCTECGNRYPSSKHLNQHVRAVHNAAGHICEICAKVCKSRSSYLQHKVCMHSEEGKRPTIQCPDCGKWLKGSTLKRHESCCSERKKVTMEVCTICEKAYPNKQALRSHNMYAHRDPMFECIYCCKAFKRAITLKEHVASSHTGEVLYSCVVCSKKFNSNANKYSHFKRAHRAEWEAAQANKTN